VAFLPEYPNDPNVLGPCPACGRDFRLFENLSEGEIFARAVNKDKFAAPDRVYPVTSLEHFSISTIQQGIVFVMAVWSGPARKAYQVLKTVLEQPAFLDVRLYVINIDQLTPEFVERELPGASFGGSGETFWVKNGKIMHAIRGFGADHRHVLEIQTESILAAPEPE
jgi:hypothetical protein